ncbi:hypothetical protein CN918_26020 [Priestia megaterium]|nr:hypothetical protein CN918_26020 [Priestia megaterium]
MLSGLLVLGISLGFVHWKKKEMNKEYERFSRFIERSTFENIPFQQREEMGYTIYYYQEDKFSLEIWKKETGFILYVNDDEIKKPVFRIEKREQDLKIFHPTIFYYRTLFEKKRKLFQAFVHRYVGDEFQNVQAENTEEKSVLPEPTLQKLPSTVQEKVAEIQTQYKEILTKKDELDIESYTLIETLVFHDLKRIIASYQELSEENQEKYEHDVLDGMNDIQTHLLKIQQKFENNQLFELKKSLRVIKERGDE